MFTFNTETDNCTIRFSSVNHYDENAHKILTSALSMYTFF